MLILDNSVSQMLFGYLLVTVQHVRDLRDVMSCHWSRGASHPLFTTSATDLRESFLFSGLFYLALLPAFRLPWGRQFNLKDSRASCWPSKHSSGPNYVVWWYGKWGYQDNFNFFKKRKTNDFPDSPIYYTSKIVNGF